MMIYFMMLITFVPVVLISTFMPYVTRRTESFGVAIPEEIYHTDELKAIRKEYAATTGTFGVLIMAVWLLFSFSVTNHWWVDAFPIMLVVFLIGSFFIYLKFHFQMRNLKEKKKWCYEQLETMTVNTDFQKKNLNLSIRWFAIPFLLALGTLVISLVFYDQIPDRIPMHYDMNGQVTNWETKSYHTVLVMPIVQLYLTALFIFINTMIAKSKQQTDAANPQKSIRQNVIFRRRWSWFNFLTGTLIVALFSCIQYTMIFALNPRWTGAVSLIVGGCIVVGSIALSFVTGQGGSRIKTDFGKRRSGMINRGDDQYWKLGMFYFNPNDPSIWVEKRFGVGWTVNFAHPLGWGSLLLIILIAVLISFLK